MRPHKKISYINYKGVYDRKTVKNSKNSLFLFSDNANRDSGTGRIPTDSDYARTFAKDGRQLHYPLVSSACIRGLSNAMPITMQHYYDREKGLTGEKVRWNDSDIEEFSAVLDADIERIKAAIETSLYDTVVLPEGGFSNSSLSAISRERTPLLYAKYMKNMKGLNEFIKSWNESAVETILPVSALADPAKFYDVFRTYANSRSKEEKRAIFEVIGDAEQQKAFIKAGAEDRGTMVIGKFDSFPDDFKEAVMALWQDSMNNNTVSPAERANNADPALNDDNVIVVGKEDNPWKLAKENGGICALRSKNGNVFGNPFSPFDKLTDVSVKTGSIKGAVEAYADWLTGADYRWVLPERRKAVLDAIFSGRYQGKPVYYYTEEIPDKSYGRKTYHILEAPNHAHVLSYFIAHPDNLRKRIDEVNAVMSTRRDESELKALPVSFGSDDQLKRAFTMKGDMGRIAEELKLSPEYKDVYPAVSKMVTLFKANEATLGGAESFRRVTDEMLKSKDGRTALERIYNHEILRLAESRRRANGVSVTQERILENSLPASLDADQSLLRPTGIVDDNTREEKPRWSVVDTQPEGIDNDSALDSWFSFLQGKHMVAALKGLVEKNAGEKGRLTNEEWDSVRALVSSGESLSSPFWTALQDAFSGLSLQAKMAARTAFEVGAIHAFIGKSAVEKAEKARIDAVSAGEHLIPREAFSIQQHLSLDIGSVKSLSPKEFESWLLYEPIPGKEHVLHYASSLRVNLIKSIMDGTVAGRVSWNGGDVPAGTPEAIILSYAEKPALLAEKLRDNVSGERKKLAETLDKESIDSIVALRDGVRRLLSDGAELTRAFDALPLDKKEALLKANGIVPESLRGYKTMMLRKDDAGLSKLLTKEYARHSMDEMKAMNASYFKAVAAGAVVALNEDAVRLATGITVSVEERHGEGVDAWTATRVIDNPVIPKVTVRVGGSAVDDESAVTIQGKSVSSGEDVLPDMSSPFGLLNSDGYKGAVEKYVSWLHCGDYLDVEPERRNAIISAVLSGALKGRAIVIDDAPVPDASYGEERAFSDRTPSFAHALAALANDPVDLYNIIAHNTGVAKKKTWTRKMVEDALKARDYRRHGRTVSMAEIDPVVENKRLFSTLDGKDMMTVLTHLPFGAEGVDPVADREFNLIDSLLGGSPLDRESFRDVIATHRDVFGLDDAGLAAHADKLYDDYSSSLPAGRQRFCRELFNALSDETLSSFSVADGIEHIKASRDADNILDAVMKTHGLGGADSMDRLARTVASIVARSDDGRCVCRSDRSMQHFFCLDAPAQSAWIRKEFSGAARKALFRAKGGETPTAVAVTATITALLDGEWGKTHGVGEGLGEKDSSLLKEVLDGAIDTASLVNHFMYLVADETGRRTLGVPAGWVGSPLQSLSDDAADALAAVNYFMKHPGSEPEMLYDKNVIAPVRRSFIKDNLSATEKYALAGVLAPDAREAFGRAADRVAFLRGDLSPLGALGSALRMEIDNALSSPEMTKARRLGELDSYLTNIFNNLPMEVRLALSLSSERRTDGNRLADFWRLDRDTMVFALNRLSEKELPDEDREVMSSLADGWEDRARERGMDERRFLTRLAADLSPAGQSALAAAVREVVTIPRSILLSDASVYVMDNGYLGNVEYALAAENAVRLLHDTGRLGAVVLVGDNARTGGLEKFCESKGIEIIREKYALPATPKKGQPPIDLTTAAAGSHAFASLMDGIAERAAGSEGKSVLVIGDEGRGMDNHRVIGAECVRRGIATEAVTAREREKGWSWDVRPEEVLLSRGLSADDPSKTVRLVRGTMADIHFRSDGAMIAGGDALLLPEDDIRASTGLFPELLAPDMSMANWGETPTFEEGRSTSVEENITDVENDVDFTLEFHLQKRSFLPAAKYSKSSQMLFRLPDLKENPDDNSTVAAENDTLVEKAAEKAAARFVNKVRDINERGNRSINIFFTGVTQPMLEYTVKMNKGASESELDGTGVVSRVGAKDEFQLRQAGLYEVQETGFRQEHMELYAKVFLAKADALLHEAGLSIGDLHTTGDSGVGVAFDYAAQRLRGRAFRWTDGEGNGKKGVHDWQHHIRPPKGWTYSLDASSDKGVELNGKDKLHYGLRIGKLEGAINGLSVSGSENLFKHRYFAGYKDPVSAEEIDARAAGLDAEAMDREALRTANGVRPLGDDVLMALRRLHYSDWQIRAIVTLAAPSWLSAEGHEEGVDGGDALESLLRYAASYTVKDASGADVAIGTPVEVAAGDVPALPVNTVRREYVDLRPGERTSGYADGRGDLDRLLDDVRRDRERMAEKGLRFISLSSSAFPAAVGSLADDVYEVTYKTPGGSAYRDEADHATVTVDRPLQGAAVEALRLLGYRGPRLAAVLKYAAPAYAEKGRRIATGDEMASFLRFVAGYRIPGGDRALGYPDGMDDRLASIGLSGSLDRLFKVTTYAPDAGETHLTETYLAESVEVVDQDEYDSVIANSGRVLDGVLTRASARRADMLRRHGAAGMKDGEYLAGAEERMETFSAEADDIKPATEEVVREQRFSAAPSAFWCRGDETLLGDGVKRVSLLADRPEVIREAAGGGTLREAGSRLAREGVVLVAPDVYSPDCRALVNGFLDAGGRLVVVSPHEAGTNRPFMAFEELDEKKRIREAARTREERPESREEDSLGIRDSYAEDTPMAFDKGSADDEDGPDAGEDAIEADSGDRKVTGSDYDRIIENGGLVLSTCAQGEGGDAVPLSVREKTAMMTSAVLGDSRLVLATSRRMGRIREMAAAGGNDGTVFVLGINDRPEGEAAAKALSRSDAPVPSFKPSDIEKPQVDTVMVFPFDEEQPSWHPYGDKDYRRYYKYDPAIEEGRSGYAYAFPVSRGGDNDYDSIRSRVFHLYERARWESDKTFYVSFPTGMMLPALDTRRLMDAFLSIGKVPANIRFPQQWASDRGFADRYAEVMGTKMNTTIVSPYVEKGDDGLAPVLDSLFPERAAQRRDAVDRSAGEKRVAASVYDSNRLDLTALRKGNRIAFLVDRREKNAVATIRKAFGNDVLICPADNAGRREALRRLDAIDTNYRFDVDSPTELFSVDGGGTKTANGLIGESVRELHFIYGRGVGLFRPEEAPTAILFGQDGRTDVTRRERQRQKRLFTDEVRPRLMSVVEEYYGELGLDPTGRYRLERGISVEDTPEQIRFFKDGSLVATVGLNDKGLVMFDNKTSDLYNEGLKDNYGMSADKESSGREADDGDRLSFEDGGHASGIAAAKGGWRRTEAFWATDAGNINSRTLKGYGDQKDNKAKALLDSMVDRLKTVLSDNFKDAAIAVADGVRRGELPVGPFRKEAVPFVERREADVNGHVEVTSGYADDGTRLVRILDADGNAVLEGDPVLRTAAVPLQEGGDDGVYVAVAAEGHRIDVYGVDGTLVSRFSAAQVGEADGNPAYAIRDEVSGLYLGSSSKMSSVLPEGVPAVETVDVASVTGPDGKPSLTLPGFAFTTRSDDGTPYLTVMLISKEGPVLAKRMDGYSLDRVLPGGFVVGRKTVGAGTNTRDVYCVIGPGGKAVLEGLDEVLDGNGIISVAKGKKRCNLDAAGRPVIGRAVINPRMIDRGNSPDRYEVSDARVVASRLLVEKDRISVELRAAEKSYRELMKEIAEQESADALRQKGKSDKEKESDMERLESVAALKTRIRELKKSEAMAQALLSKVAVAKDILRDSGVGATVGGSLNMAALMRTVRKLRKVNDALQDVATKDALSLVEAVEHRIRPSYAEAARQADEQRTRRLSEDAGRASQSERAFEERRASYKEIREYGDICLCLRQDGLWQYTDKRLNGIGKPWASLSEPGRLRYCDGVALAYDAGHRAMLLAADGSELLPAMADRVIFQPGFAKIYRTDTKGNKVDSIFDYGSHKEISIRTLASGEQVLLGADGSSLAAPAVTIDVPSNGVVSLFRLDKDGGDVRSWLSLDTGREYRIAEGPDGMSLVDMDGNVIMGPEVNLEANLPDYGVVTVYGKNDTTYFSVITGKAYPSMDALYTDVRKTRTVDVPAVEETAVREESAAGEEELSALTRAERLDEAAVRLDNIREGIDDAAVGEWVRESLDALERDAERIAPAEAERAVAAVVERLTSMREAAARRSESVRAVIGMLEGPVQEISDIPSLFDGNKTDGALRGTALAHQQETLSSVEAGLSDSLVRDRWAARDYIIDGERHQIVEAQGEKHYERYWKTYLDVDMDRLRSDALQRTQRLDAAINALDAANPVTELVRTKLAADYPKEQMKAADQAGTLAVVTLQDGKYLARVETRELLAGPFAAVGTFDRPGVEGFCSVKTLEGEYNFLNKEGCLVLDRSYKEISTPGCGLVKVGMETENGMRYNFIDINTGRTVSSEWYVNGIQKGQAPDEWNVVESPGDDHEPRFNYINYQGQLMFNSPVDSAKAFKDHTGYIRVADAWYRIDEGGKKVARLKREPGESDGMGGPTRS